MRRTLFTIIIALLGVTGAWAKETTHTVNNLIYTVVQPATGEKYAILSGYENSPEGKLDIPGLIRVKETTGIITVLVTMIGEQAFIDREKITEVNIPSSIKSIGDKAFEGCISLTSFNVSNENANFCSENGILFNKDKTTLLQYPPAKADTGYSIPDGVTKIGDRAFSDCNKLTVMTIPGSVATIGEEALKSCTDLTELFVHATTPPTVGTNAFMNVNLDIPVYVPDASLDTYKAAAGWKDFTNLQAPVTEFTVDNLKYKVTDNTANEVELTGYATKPTGKLYIPTSLTYGSKTYLVTGIKNDAFYGCSEITEVTIPTYVKSIGMRAFYGCTSLKNLEIVNGVTSIGDEAFSKCSALTKVTIPESVTSLGQVVFAKCSSLTQATIGNGVTEIRFGLFGDCTALEKVVIGKGVTKIGGYAFTNCSKIKEMTVQATVPPTVENAQSLGSISRDIPVYVPLEALSAYKANNSWKKFTNLQPISTEFTVDKLKYNVTDLVANTVEIIYGYVEGALNIPATVTYAGTKYKVTSIGAEAFLEADITSLTIPDGITDIKFNAFALCMELTEVNISKSVTNMEGLVFYYCEALRRINVDAANTVYSSENGVLFNKNKTTLLQYPIGRQETTYTVPSSVTTIVSLSFSTCTTLKELTLSKNVSSIEAYAFENCTAITKMTVLATVPPAVETESFLGIDKSIPVYVPAASLAAYKTAEVWKEFTNLQAISGTAIDTPSMPESISIQGGMLHNPQQLPVIIYDLTGRLVYSGNATTVELPAGIYVVSCNGASCKAVF